MAAITKSLPSAVVARPGHAARMRRRRDRAKAIHIIWLVLGALYFLIPIYSLVQFSMEGGAHGPAWFHWYRFILDDPVFRSSFWISLQISLETVVVGVILMVPTVFWIHLRLPSLRPIMDLITILPFVVPPIVLIVGLTHFLHNFPWLVVRPEVLAFIYVVFALPFIYRALDAGLSAIDLKTLVEAAENPEITRVHREITERVRIIRRLGFAALDAKERNGEVQADFGEGWHEPEGLRELRDRLG